VNRRRGGRGREEVGGGGAGVEIVRKNLHLGLFYLNK